MMEGVKSDAVPAQANSLYLFGGRCPESDKDLGRKGSFPQRKQRKRPGSRGVLYVITECREDGNKFFSMTCLEVRVKPLPYSQKLQSKGVTL